MLDFGSEKPLWDIALGLGAMQFDLTSRFSHERLLGTPTNLYRAFDGSLGLWLDLDQPEATEAALPLDAISAWLWLEPEEDLPNDVPSSGNREDLKRLLKPELDELFERPPDGYPFGFPGAAEAAWAECVEDEAMARLAPRDLRNWHKEPENMLFYTLAASTAGEDPSALATRVGGALWAAYRIPNTKRVAVASRLIGVKGSDRAFIQAARKIDAHDVTRVHSAAMFVGLGGGSATSETLRLLTLLQQNTETPRFF